MFGDIPRRRDDAWGQGCKQAPGPAAPASLGPALVPMPATMVGAGARSPAPVALSGFPQGAPTAQAAQGGAAVLGPTVPGVPELILGAGGCPAAQLRHCLLGGVRGAGPADRLKVLAHTVGEASRLICQMIIIAF